MAGTDMTLGFLGTQQLNPRETEPLLAELVAGHRRTNRKAEVRSVVAGVHWTPSLEELAEFCIREGYRFGLLGPPEFVNSLPRFAEIARSNMLCMTLTKPGVSVGRSLAASLIAWKKTGHETRLIVLAKDEDMAGDEGDPVIMDAIEGAAEGDVTIRSLVKGLEEVKIEQEVDVPVTPIHDGQDWEADEDDEVDEEPETEDLDEEVEEDEEEPPEEGEDLDEEEEDDEPPEDEDEESDDDDVESDEGAEDEEGFFDAKAGADVETEEDEEDAEIVEDEEEPDDEEAEEEPEPEERPAPRAERRTTDVPQVKFTEAGLMRLAQKDYKAFRELVDEYGVPTGRGIKIPSMVRGLLDATGHSNGTAPARPAKKAATKKTAIKKIAAKKAPAKKRAAKVPAKKVRVEKETVPTKRVAKKRAVQSQREPVVEAQSRIKSPKPESERELFRQLIDGQIAALQLVRDRL